MKGKKISDFQANPFNPRQISDEQLAMLRGAMEAFGDLSGLVVNLTTGNMIGGHQRVKILGERPVAIMRKFDPPTKRGTVAEGVVSYGGERFTYREVRWPVDKEKAAMIAANKQGGDWDIPALSSLLLDLRESETDMPLLGFSSKELSALFDEDEIKIPDDALPKDMRSVLLVLGAAVLPEFMEQVHSLGEKFKTETITDTVVRAVETCYNWNRHADNKVSEAVAADAK
jgi:hypothetical protein